MEERVVDVLLGSQAQQRIAEGFERDREAAGGRTPSRSRP